MACPRRFRFAGPWLAACALALGALPAAAAGWADDPVHVYYERGDCPGHEIELQIWNRRDRLWQTHPGHARVPVPSCQIEHAGWLLNELRWRCTALGPEAPWRGFQVFDPEVMSRCAVDGLASDGGAEIVVASPPEGEPVRAPEAFVTLTGNVRIRGLDGSDYDVVLAFDRSAPVTALSAQAAAARALVDALAPRLAGGSVRVAVLSVADAVPHTQEPGGVRQEIGFSSDAAALERVLTKLATPSRAARQGSRAASREALAPLLSAALERLARGRQGARAVLLVGTDGARLGRNEALGPTDPLRQALALAVGRGVQLHWRALGGATSQAPRWLQGAIDESRGSFEQLPVQRHGERFWADVSLPVVSAVEVRRSGAEPIEAALDAQGRFRARVPVLAGSNPLTVHARTSDGGAVERPYEVVFDDGAVLDLILEGERERIRAAQRKHLDLRTESEEER